MDSHRNAMLAGLFVLVLLALGVAWFVLNPGAGPSGPVPVNTASAPPLDAPEEPRADAPSNRAATGNGALPTAAGDAATAPDVTAAALGTEATTVFISGRAIDFFEEGASGVTLTLLREDADSISGPTAVSGDDGNFRFEVELRPGESWFVACLEEGKALTATQPFTLKVDEPVEGLLIRIFAAARVHGVVLNGADNEPLPDVNISINARADARLQRLGRLLGRFKPVTSNERGEFAVESIAPGSYLVEASKRGWAANEMDPMVRGRQDVTLQEYSSVELLPFVLVQGGVIAGRVMKRSDRSPIAAASVELGTPLGGTFATTTTDDNGNYEFDSAPPSIPGPGGLGGLAVRAIAPGYAIASRNVQVESGAERRNINLLLTDGATVRGLVVSADREPVAGASVYFNDNAFPRGSELVVGVTVPPRRISTTTNEAGEFTLDNLPAEAIGITASAEGFANQTSAVTAVTGETAEVTIVLQREGWLEGVVTGPRGEPVADVAVAAYNVESPNEVSIVMRGLFGETLPDRGESPMFPSRIRSDQDGAYRVDGLPAGRYVLVANTRRFQKYISAELEVKQGAGTRHDIRLQVGGTIYGRVLDGTARPVAGAAISAASRFSNEMPRIRTAYSDRNGQYEITGLVPDTYSVVRNDGNFMRLFQLNPANQVKVGAGERVEFDIYEQRPGTARVYGRVTLDGLPHASQSIVLVGAGRGGFSMTTTTTDEGGFYEFRSVPLGSYQIAQAQGPFPSLVRQRVFVDREGDFEFDVKFQTVTLSGRVEVEGGKVPEGRVRVIATPVNPNAADSGTAEEQVNPFEMMVAREIGMDRETGAFELNGLSPGFYRVTVRSENNGMVTRPYINLRVSAGGVVFTLPAQGAILKGTVAGLDNAANNTPFGLIGALTIEDDRGLPIALGGFDNGVNLSESKEFEVRNLAEGQFTITLSVNGYTPVTHSNVRMRPGETVALTFTFAPSGNVKILLANDELDIQTALSLEYEIRNSKGELFNKRFTFLDFFDAEGGVSQGDDNSFTIKDLPPESYTIQITISGHKPVNRAFTIIAGETASISVEFEKE